MMHNLILLALLAAPETDPAQEPAPAPPRIAVREGRFVQADSGAPFIPRGFNYIRLSDEWHSTFAPGEYDPDRSEAMFQDLHRHGFNVVRVFIDHLAERGVVASKDATGLSPAYMANVLDFLQRAQGYRIYVIFSLVWIPECARYADMAGEATPGVEGVNQLYLNAGHIRAKALYMADFVRAIRGRDPRLLAAVFAYEPCNEASFVADSPPFSTREGTCTPADRKTYDLASESQLQDMADAHIVLWTDTCAKAVREVDPDALVSVNVFTFRAVGRTGPGRLFTDETPDVRFPARPLALAKSSIDYLDIHLYPHDASTLGKDLASIEFDAVKAQCRAAGKPLIMGEFGAHTHSYPTLDAAVPAMKTHLADARRLGFQGFLYWTYDCGEQPGLWNAEAGAGELFRMIAAATESSVAPPPLLDQRVPSGQSR